MSEIIKTKRPSWVTVKDRHQILVKFIKHVLDLFCGIAIILNFTIFTLRS